eukprot:767003-Hanusia_phi.AAC.4
MELVDNADVERNLLLGDPRDGPERLLGSDTSDQRNAGQSHLVLLLAPQTVGDEVAGRRKAAAKWGRGVSGHGAVLDAGDVEDPREERVRSLELGSCEERHSEAIAEGAEFDEALLVLHAVALAQGSPRSCPERSVRWGEEEANELSHRLETLQDLPHLTCAGLVKVAPGPQSQHAAPEWTGACSPWQDGKGGRDALARDEMRLPL